MKIAIFGIDGQLGTDLATAFESADIIPVPHDRVDITNEEGVSSALSSTSPDWVINAAAMTHVDRCETQAPPAFGINALGARNIARACSRSGARLIQISTDYVFDGKNETPYVEDDVPRPINVYGMTKLAGEMFVQDSCERHYIIRTSGLYGLANCRGKGTNFVETMLRLSKEHSELRVVMDERLTPTFTEDLAALLNLIVKNEPAFGVYHATNEGHCSWFDFATEIFRLTQLPIAVSGITSKEWGSPTRRPENSVLSSEKLASQAIDRMPDWHDALERYLSKRTTRLPEEDKLGHRPDRDGAKDDRQSEK